MIVELGIAGLVGSILAFGRKRPDRSFSANGHGLAPGNPMQLPPLIRAVVEGRGNDRLALIGAIAEARVYGLQATMEVLEKKLIRFELEQARMIQAPESQPEPEAAVPVPDTNPEELLAMPSDDVTGPAEPAPEIIAIPVEVADAEPLAPRNQKNGKGRKIEKEQDKPVAEVAERKEG